MPLRLRSVAVIAVPALGVAPVAAWALSKDAFTEQSLQPLSAREAVAGDFGLMLLAMCVVLFAAGIAVGLATAAAGPPRWRACARASPWPRWRAVFAVRWP